ncbi:hypothetical protein IWQ61_006345 [Dispira simplex]|nr:hypothetical protein IWQ61_006345 [Dispira simplex]
MTDLTVERINQMKHAELKEQLQLLGMPSTGRKNSLKERLLEHLQQAQTDSVTESPIVPNVETSLQETTTELHPVGNGRDQAEVATPSIETASAVPKETQPDTTTASPLPTKIEPSAEPVVAEAAAQAVDSEEEKRRRRAERFGLKTLQDPKLKSGATEELKAHVTSKAVAIDEETIRKRRERFGAVPTQNLAAVQLDTSPKSSVQPSGHQVEQPVVSSAWSELDEEKKRKRAERFAQKPLVSVSELLWG